MYNLAGGELAARLSPSVRIEMIRNGFNPLNPEDVERFSNNQKPAEGVNHMIGEAALSKKHLGEGQYDDRRDYGIISKSKGDAAFDLDAYEQAPVNPRAQVKDMMSSYGRGNNETVDLNTKLMQRLDSRRSSQSLRQEQPEYSQKSLPIAQPKQILIEGEEKAKQLGYNQGLKYINAFIDLIKTPTTENRAKMIHELNKTILYEDKVEGTVLKSYRTGVSLAEKALYNKIRQKSA